MSDGKLVLAKLLAGSNVIGKTIAEETAPTDSSKNNPSLVLAYTGSNLTTITKTIGSTAYAKTLTYDVDDNLETVSGWSAA